MFKFFFYVAAFSLPLVSRAQTTVDFENFQFPSGQNYWNGSDQTGDFTINGATFTNSYNPDWSSWSGFAVSSEVDVTTAGWMNQYSSFAASGAANSEKFALWYANGEISFDVPTQPLSMAVTNTTYSALSMQDGDDYAKKFGSIYNANGEEDGTEGKDWFKLTIIGMNADNEVTGEIDFYLADFRSKDTAEHFILNTWQTIDLSGLGTVSKILFEMSSSDVGAWGMNTPGYFVLDNLQFNQSDVSLDNQPAFRYSVYPNPAVDFVTINSTSELEFSVKLLNINGEIVMESNDNTNHNLNLNFLADGVYFLQMSSSMGVLTERIVLAK